MNLKMNKQLPTPKELRDMFPLDEECAETKEKNDAEIRAIFKGESKKFLIIIGPCSADREDAVIDYVKRLREIYPKINDVITIVPRIYTNKPRTMGTGYKGMLHQPDPEGSPDLLKGLISIRKLHMRAIRETGFSCADEMLYPENHAYLADCLSYVAVGARSVENQAHRLVASGIDVPVGMKNPTSGDLTVMLNSIHAAQFSHNFIYRGWEAESTGNPLTHAILRGYVDEEGKSNPNYHYETLAKLAQIYSADNFENPALIIDCNHSNSGKRYLEQIRIAEEVLASMSHDPKVRNLVKGLMIESYIEDGCQKIGEGVYGKSITDPCLGWEKTKDLLFELADKLRKLK
ncbi:MAG: 3-deoxy-7-phosphoheptulonate synthase [Bacilli bacterium]|nr:3-deoxy-7-phosphoheptulonate synthase [Bacilli bacterium]